MIALDSDRSTKIQAHHLNRLAIVYVRQSGSQQAERHPESAAVQANLKEKALAWGWPADRVLVWDGDQGKSATSAEDRQELTRLFSEISLEHVGLVLVFQINRLLREDETCVRLIKLCRLFDTLVADMDGVYHAQDFNDRVLLSFKGMIGSIELHQIQQRMQSGRLNRARRGEWLGDAPLGYVIGNDGKLALDPDEQVRERIGLLFDAFDRQGSISGLLRWLAQQQLQLPMRSRDRANKGELQWRLPHRETLRNLLRHPAYCGTYTWGRRIHDASKAVAGRRGTGRKGIDPKRCAVFLPENHAAYITPARYEANVRRLAQQAQRGPRPSAASQSAAMLNGLVVCGHCGSRMQTHYTRSLRYACHRELLDHGTAHCQSFSGSALDRLVSEQVLRAVEPASLELSRQAAQDIEQQRRKLHQDWQLRLERAQHDVDRAWRQYNAVEPENRLVARTLERHWEQALSAQRDLREEHDRFRQAEPIALSESELKMMDSLASDLPALWNSPATSLCDKRQVVRLLLAAVKVSTSRETDVLSVECHWAMGVVTQHQIRRRVTSWRKMSDYEELLSRLQALRTNREHWSTIADRLNAEGFQSPSGSLITEANARKLWSRIQPSLGESPRPEQPPGGEHRADAAPADHRAASPSPADGPGATTITSTRRRAALPAATR